MPKRSNSQWDFGELFPQGTGRVVLSVSALTAQVRLLVERHFKQIWVAGEVTNLRTQSSGHLYFTLKDSGAQLACVLFRGEVPSARSLLADGRSVLLCGELTVYEPRGQYQLHVLAVELQGAGALQMAFEELKRRLADEGLFASEHKRPLPRFPERIGLVTSPTGAAIRDVLHVLQRRQPGLEVVLAPCRVQGEGAAREIAQAIRDLNEFARSDLGKDIWPLGVRPRGNLDLILLTRGGGSLEDLWAFNEEVVARAIFESELPVVSAVGHEIDFTISDLAADVRAATPSAGAELITQNTFASREFVGAVPQRFRQLVGLQLARRRRSSEDTTARLVRRHPRRRLRDRDQQLDDLQSTLFRLARQGLRERSLAGANLLARLRHRSPARLLDQRVQSLTRTRRQLRELARHRLQSWRQRFTLVEARLRLLGPEQVLARGYSITTDAVTGEVLRNAAQVKKEQKLRTRLRSGEVVSQVTE